MQRSENETETVYNAQPYSVGRTYPAVEEHSLDEDMRETRRVIGKKRRILNITLLLLIIILLGILCSLISENMKKSYEETGDEYPPAPFEETGDVQYRVRNGADGASTQVGAFSVWENAVDEARRYAGYSVYDMEGNLLYSP